MSLETLKHGCHTSGNITRSTPELPHGFPQSFDSPLAWTGATLVDKSEYLHVLSNSEIQEAESALERFKSLGLDGDLANPENFPLPTLGPRLYDIRWDIHEGKGFGVLRGLDPRKYSVEDLTILHLGIQSHVANRYGRQDEAGNMIVHIIGDDSSKFTSRHHRHSNAPIMFHNEDAGDVISWLTRSRAVTGGKCILASAYTVYNILSERDPDLVRTLSQADWIFFMPTIHRRPLFFCHKGRLIVNFNRAAVLGSDIYHRPSKLRKVTSRQKEALDTIEEIARTVQIEISTEVGDIHFINNLAILHRRDGFVDGEESNERRHLMRMRLRHDDYSWELPTELQREWGQVFDQAAPRKWHLEPQPKGYFPLRSQAN